MLRFTGNFTKLGSPLLFSNVKMRKNSFSCLLLVRQKLLIRQFLYGLRSQDQVTIVTVDTDIRKSLDLVKDTKDL